MKKIAIFFIFVFSSVYAAHGQQPEWKMIFLDELHFTALFPEQPQASEGEFYTGYGRALSRRWTLNHQDISYEVVVTDFPELSVTMDYKPLNFFYDAVRNNLVSHHGTKYGEHSDTLFGEYGRGLVLRNDNETVNIRMHLVRQRLYQVKVVIPTSREKDERTLDNVKMFLEHFLFVQQKENEKNYSFGLPQAVSQNLKGR